jgi:murein DD-endopeptidase MepM/ murein hydrolase activator NlpD
VQRNAIDATRQQLQGKADALAKRVGTLNAHLIRLDALGRRITDLADLDRGEFNFDAPRRPWPRGRRGRGGSVAVPELAATLDALELQLQDRDRQLVVLENLMAMRELGERIIPGGLPLVGGWISSHYGYRSDPFTGTGPCTAGSISQVGPAAVSCRSRPAWCRTRATRPVTATSSRSATRRDTSPATATTRATSSGSADRAEGDAVAVIGSTGRSTGTHVHFEVERDGKVLDPSRFLAVR